MAICVIIYLISTVFITVAEEGCFGGPLSKGAQCRRRPAPIHLALCLALCIFWEEGTPLLKSHSAPSVLTVFLPHEFHETHVCGGFISLSPPVLTQSQVHSKYSVSMCGMNALPACMHEPMKAYVNTRC